MPEKPVVAPISLVAEDALCGESGGLLDYYARVTKPDGDPELEQATRLWQQKQQREAAEARAKHERDRRNRIAQELVDQAYQSQEAADNAAEQQRQSEALLRSLSKPRTPPPTVILITHVPHPR